MKILKREKPVKNIGTYEEPLNIADKPLKPEDDGKYVAKCMKPEDVNSSHVVLTESNLSSNGSDYHISSILDLIVERENQEENQ